jgi:hypothetical protein
MTTTDDRRRRVPGVVLRTLVSRLFDNRTAERFLFPAIADLQHETAGSAGLSAVRRRAALWRNYLAFWKSFVTCLLTPPSAGVRADIYRLGWSGGFFVCATTAVGTHAKSSQRSSGRRPVRVAMRTSMRGPSSSSS